ncbi:MAG: hypothetical protein QOJ80_379 [Mycobacterium sp.]|jgi:hypothetical protein|nr:hypothetical protein [Mycobacterium sp.]
MSDGMGMQADTSWDPASVDMPPMPTISPGEDGLSMTIAAVMPTLSAPLAANVTALQAKETMFSGKVDSAKSAYQNADDQGNQGIGQIGQMLGQVGQMAQQAGKAGGGEGGSSIFGSLMEQAMKAVQSGGSKDGGSQGADAQAADQPQAGSPGAGQPAASQGAGGQGGGGQGPAGGAPGAQQQPSREGQDNRQDQTPQHEREAKAHEAPVEQPPAEAAGPGERQHNAGPAPVSPPAPTRHGDEDLSRRM